MYKLPTIYSFGYGEKDAAERLEKIMEEAYRPALIDTRKSPQSAKDGGIWTSHALRKRWGEQYVPLGHLLGNVNYRPEDRAKGIKLVDEAQGIQILRHGFFKERSLVLLCGCANGQTCHRTYIAKAFLRSIRGCHHPFDVDEALTRDMLTDDKHDQVLALIEQKRRTIDLLEQEGIGIQILELLVS
jgi:hypothetical protein